MDIEGAKALKRRLGTNGTDETPSASADVPENAPPVYHWVGVSRPPAETPPDLDEPAASSASLFRRLGLSFR